jgi:hypothetical protein
MTPRFPPALLLPAALLTLTSCASVLREPEADVAALLRVPAFRLEVRCDAPDLAPLLEDLARITFSERLPLGEDPGGGRIELLFSGRTTSPDVSISVGAGTGQPAGVSPMGAGARTGMDPRGEGSRRYTNADLLLVLRDGEGRRLYAVRCRVRGRWGLVETPEDAARLCLKRAAEDLFRLLDGSAAAGGGP